SAALVYWNWLLPPAPIAYTGGGVMTLDGSDGVGGYRRMHDMAVRCGGNVHAFRTMEWWCGQKIW
ncbi:MAG TPA: hypothetical protein VFQ43_08430, partial [Nitrososphaera sp.]|nr:hypothetical protein [Nitrososphaera sp.]